MLGRLDSTASSTTRARSTRSRRSSIRPWLMRLTSIRSSISRDITPHLAGDDVARPGAPAPRMSFWYCSSCAALRTGASGLRSSCASVAMNSSLRRPASRSSASSCSSARVRSATSRSRFSFSSCSSLLGAAPLGHLGEQGAVGDLDLAALAVQLGEHRDLRAQHRRVDRLVQVVDRAAAVALEDVLVLVVVGGEEDDRDAAPSSCGP